MTKLNSYHREYLNHTKIQSLGHFKWGWERLFIDGLLFYGNVNKCFKHIKSFTYKELVDFYKSKCFFADQIQRRGEFLEIENIADKDRYLISEMACKNLSDARQYEKRLEKRLKSAWNKYEKYCRTKSQEPNITVEKLLHLERNVNKDNSTTQLDDFFQESSSDHQPQTTLDDIISNASAEEIREVDVRSYEDIQKCLKPLKRRFEKVRNIALRNTKKYLSMVDDLDVYVATSMRSKKDFMNMAERCEEIFGDNSLSAYDLSYFDPTLSAANCDEDKGLIECLMVKSAKVLIYFSGSKDSYGKDAEAAMALSHGKNVIFFCDQKEKEKFFSSTHPLTRLIDVKTGVAVGAMVTSEIKVIPKLLKKIFTNDLEFKLEADEAFYRLKEKITSCTIRLQTNNQLLSETFWNHYQKPAAKYEYALYRHDDYDDPRHRPTLEDYMQHPKEE